MENDNFSSHADYTDCIGGSGPDDTSNLFCHRDIDTLISLFLANLTNWVFGLTWGFCESDQKETQAMLTC